MHYYLDTNAIYDLKKYPVSLLTNSFTSAFTLLELVSGVTDVDSFKYRKGALNQVNAKQLAIVWQMPEQLIYNSFNVFNGQEFKSDRIKQLNRLIEAMIVSETYTAFCESEAYRDEFGFHFFKGLDDWYSETFIAASANGITSFKAAFQSGDEDNTLEYNDEIFVLNTTAAAKDFFSKFPEVTRAITITGMVNLARAWLGNNQSTDEELFNSYNYSIVTYVKVFSNYTISKLIQKNIPAKNDFADLTHLLYLKNYQNICIVSDDKLFRKYLAGQSMTIQDLRIKKSYLSSKHDGIQPIRVLQHNITHRFENTNPGFLSASLELVNKLGLKPGISYYAYEEAILYSTKDFRSQTPYVDENKKIALHETFLAYMWSVCYSMLVLYDEAVAKPMQNQQAAKILHIIDQETIDSAKALLQYGRSIISNFSPWDKVVLPNPEEYSPAEYFYITKANGLFIFAINFILCHEYAHVEKTHIDRIGIATQLQRRQFEKEADDRAIELMLKGRDGTNDKSIELGILMGLSALLFFTRDTSGGKFHPDTDNRINNFLELLNAPVEAPIWGVAVLFFKIWDEQFNLQFSWPTQVNDFKELFYITLKQVSDRKKI